MTDFSAGSSLLVPVDSNPFSATIVFPPDVVGFINGAKRSRLQLVAGDRRRFCHPAAFPER